MTLIELTAAAVIGSLIAGATMMAFMTATKVSRQSSTQRDLMPAAQETLEKYRNRIACDDPWFNPATCVMAAQNAVAEALTAPSLLAMGGTRDYTMTPADCDGDTVVGDCYRASVHINWTVPQ